jgi:hypothetical protein
LLSDERLELTTALGLPTFEVDGMTLLKRPTLFLRDGTIESVIYPVFPANRNAKQALARLAASPIPHTTFDTERGTRRGGFRKAIDYRALLRLREIPAEDVR